VAADVKIPWFVDLLNLNLENHDVKKARRRIAQYLDLLKTGHRITENPDFGPSSPAEHA
jgi:malate synthase